MKQWLEREIVDIMQWVEGLLMCRMSKGEAWA